MFHSLTNSESVPRIRSHFGHNFRVGGGTSGVHRLDRPRRVHRSSRGQAQRTSGRSNLRPALWGCGEWQYAAGGMDDAYTSRFEETHHFQSHAGSDLCLPGPRVRTAGLYRLERLDDIYLRVVSGG